MNWLVDEKFLADHQIVKIIEVRYVKGINHRY